MKQINLNEILLTELKGLDPVFNGIRSYSFYGVLYKNDISTVGELLNNQALQSHCSKETRIELEGFVSLIRHKLLNKPLINEEILEYQIKETDDFFKTSETIANNNLYISAGYSYTIFLKLGFSKKQARYLKNLIYQIDKTSLNLESNPKIIDYFKFIKENSRNKNSENYEEYKKFNIEPILELYINEYNKKHPSEKKNNPIPSETEKLERLKAELEELELQRTFLNQQIEYIKNEIEKHKTRRR